MPRSPWIAGGTVGDLMDLFRDKHKEDLEEKKQNKKASGVEKGDVICVNRGAYYHFGVYNHRNSIFHYHGETKAEARIIETSLSEFLDGAREYQVCVFPDEHGKPEKVSFPSPFQGLFSLPDLIGLLKKIQYKLYPPDEVISRAKSRLGEDSYSLPTNNCEHYAIWCKTGISESHQIEDLVKIIVAGPIFVPA